MILDGELKAKWKKNMLNIISEDRDTANIMKKLVNNVETISTQNYELLHYKFLFWEMMITKYFLSFIK